jgi:iron complex transport system substrate-binding protein
MLPALFATAGSLAAARCAVTPPAAALHHAANTPRRSMTGPVPCRAPARWRAYGLLLCLLPPASGLSGAAAAGVGPALPSVASTDLCSDLLLLQIGAPGQIVSVSAAAQDPALSPLAAAAGAYPANRGRVEELLHLAPDIALVYLGWDGRGFAGLLAGQGIRIEPLPYPGGWTQTLATTRETAALIGRAQAGAALAAAADPRMQALAGSVPPYRVLYLRPNGGTAGAGTYVHDVLAHLGLRNLAAEQGYRGWGRFPLELLVAEPPDLFLLGYFDQAQPLSKSAYARHPLLRGLLESTPTVNVPTGGWGCGGLELVDVAERIAAQIAALPLPGRPDTDGR